MTTIWIDDARALPSFYDVRAATVEEALLLLETAKRDGHHISVVSFDYDAHHTLNWTFMPVAEWMRDNDFWPAEIRIHTYNYWTGRPELSRFFEKYAPKTTVVDETDPWLYTPYLSNRAALDPETAPEWVRQFLNDKVKVNG